MHSDVATTDGELGRDQLESLRNNPELVDILQHGRLQAQITDILNSADPEASLAAMMQGAPEFSSFVQNMLLHLGLRDAQGISTL
jgi:hypothetical protein